MGRARGTVGSAVAGLRAEAAEREARFIDVFGVGRSSSARAEDYLQRSYQHPGPLLELYRRNGRRIWARIIRYGDCRGAEDERLHLAARPPVFKKLVSDNHLVSFMEEMSEPELRAKHPNGFPFSGYYFVGTLRTDRHRLAEDGLAFSTDPQYEAANLPGDQCRLLLDWLDTQCVT